MKAIAIFALVALMVVPVFADTEGDCVVTLTIDYYIWVTVDATASIHLQNGATAGDTEDINWNYGCNLAAHVDGELVYDENDPWTWAMTFPVAGYNVDETTNTAGTPFTVGVTGATMENDGVGNHTATVTLTIAAQ
jgi:hypothetical protein